MSELRPLRVINERRQNTVRGPLSPTTRLYDHLLGLKRSERGKPRIIFGEAFGDLERQTRRVETSPQRLVSCTCISRGRGYRRDPIVKPLAAGRR